MLKIGDYVSICYVLVSSASLVYQLGTVSVASFQCGHSVTVCARNGAQEVQQYVLKANELAYYCNTEPQSYHMLRLAVLFLSLGHVVASIAVMYHFRIKRCIDMIERLTNTVVGTNVVLFCGLILLPSLYYIGKSNKEHSLWYHYLTSPAKTMFWLVAGTITAPTTMVVDFAFGTSLNIDQIIPNLTCAEAALCERTGSAMDQKWSAAECDLGLVCADQCDVIFPCIVMNSLTFIFTSTMLSYRIFRLSREETHETSSRDNKTTATSTVQGNNTGRQACNVDSMRDGSVGRQADVSYNTTRKIHISSSTKTETTTRRKSRSSTPPVTTNGVRREEHADKPTAKLSASSLRPKRMSPIDKRLQENGYVQRRSASPKTTTAANTSSARNGNSSSNEDTDIVLEEDESEFYMSGFRL